MEEVPGGWTGVEEATFTKSCSWLSRNKKYILFDIVVLGFELQFVF